MTTQNLVERSRELAKSGRSVDQIHATLKAEFKRSLPARKIGGIVAAQKRLRTQRANAAKANGNTGRRGPRANGNKSGTVIYDVTSRTGHLHDQLVWAIQGYQAQTISAEQFVSIVSQFNR